MLLTITAYTLFFIGLMLSARLAGESLDRLEAQAGIARSRAAALPPHRGGDLDGGRLFLRTT